MKRAYKFLLLLYPREHRDRFANEMTEVFEEPRNDQRARGWNWYVRFAFGEVMGLFAGVADAWLARVPVVANSVANAPYSLPPELADAQGLVDSSIAGIVHAIANHQFERARLYSYEERQAREKLRVLREKYGFNN